MSEVESFFKSAFSVDNVIFGFDGNELKVLLIQRGAARAHSAANAFASGSRCARVSSSPLVAGASFAYVGGTELFLKVYRDRGLEGPGKQQAA